MQHNNEEADSCMIQSFKNESKMHFSSRFEFTVLLQLCECILLLSQSPYHLPSLSYTLSLCWQSIKLNFLCGCLELGGNKLNFFFG